MPLRSWPKRVVEAISVRLVPQALRYKPVDIGRDGYAIFLLGALSRKITQVLALVTFQTALLYAEKYHFLIVPYVINN